MEPMVIWKTLRRNLGSSSRADAEPQEPSASGTPTQETQLSETQPSATQLVRLQLRVQQGGRIRAEPRNPVVTPPAEGAEGSNK